MNGTKSSRHLGAKTAMTSPVPLWELPEDRRALVARLRGEIARGTYETAERLEGALEAFLGSPDAGEFGSGKRHGPEGNFGATSAQGMQGPLES
jgi:hypothetical protein